MTRDEEEVAFYHQLGMAICNWNFVESGVYKIMSAVSDKNEHLAIGYGFFAIDNFRAKLAFADAFMKKKLKDAQHLETWDRLTVRLRKLVARRNRLAHDRAMVYFYAPAGRRYALEHWPDDTPRKRKSNSSWPPRDTPRDGALCLRDVVSCKRDFFWFSSELQNFEAALLGRKEPHPEVHARPESPPTNAAIVRQIREGLGLPPKPSRPKSSARPSKDTDGKAKTA
jgi:hypothetical protein